MLYMVGRTDFHQLRSLRNQFRLVDVGVDGQVQEGIGKIFRVIQGGSIDRGLNPFESQSDEVGGNYGLKQNSELGLEIAETAGKIVVIVLGKITDMNILRERCQGAGQIQHG